MRRLEKARIDLRERGWVDVDWIHLNQQTDQWPPLVNAIMILRVPKRRRISWQAEWLLPSQWGLCFMEL